MSVGLFHQGPWGLEGVAKVVPLCLPESDEKSSVTCTRHVALIISRKTRAGFLRVRWQLLSQLQRKLTMTLLAQAARSLAVLTAFFSETPHAWFQTRLRNIRFTELFFSVAAVGVGSLSWSLLLRSSSAGHVATLSAVRMLKQNGSRPFGAPVRMAISVELGKTSAAR